MKPTNDSSFVDTNLLVYLYSGDELGRRSTVLSAIADQNLCITTQVLSELANVLLKKFGLSIDDVERALQETCAACQVTLITPGLISSALRIRERYGYAFYDSQIIAGALAAGAAVLYSEDLQHGQIIDGILSIQSPFTRGVQQSRSSYRAKTRAPRMSRVKAVTRK